MDGSVSAEVRSGCPYATSASDRFAEGIEDARRIIAEAEAEHGPISKKFLLVSGGNDSMVLLSVCRNWVDGIVHINTGVGIAETSAFVRRVVAEYGKELIEMHPPISYRDLVLGRWQGFPGPGGHRFAYTMLKERPIRQLLRDHRTKRGERFMLLTGVRKAESQRRMGREETRREGGQVWVNPLVNWSNELMREYRETMALPVNEVTKHLHMSGECLCGAFAKPGELEEVGFFYPSFKSYIERLQDEAREAGIAACEWGKRPPKPKRRTVIDEWCATCGEDAGTDVDEHVENGGTIDHPYDPVRVERTVSVADEPLDIGPLCNQCELWQAEEAG